MHVTGELFRLGNGYTFDAVLSCVVANTVIFTWIDELNDKIVRVLVMVFFFKQKTAYDVHR